METGERGEINLAVGARQSVGIFARDIIAPPPPLKIGQSLSLSLFVSICQSGLCFASSPLTYSAGEILPSECCFVLYVLQIKDLGYKFCSVRVGTHKCGTIRALVINLRT